MSRAEARRWLHGMLHGLPCLPCADAAAPVAQACYPATEPNSYRSLRYHFIVRLTLTSSHPWPQQARQAASGRPHDGLGSRCVHRSLTQIRAASVRDPCRHTGHENEAAWRSVLPTSRGHAFESLAQWGLSATTVARVYRSRWPLAWPRRGQ